MARNVYEKEKLAHEKAISDEIEGYEAIIARADEEGRRLTDSENEDIAHSIKRVKTIQSELDEVNESIKTLDDVREIGRKLGPPGMPSGSARYSVGDEPEDRLFRQMNAAFPQAQKSLGEQFVSSSGYKKAMDVFGQSGGRLPEGFTTGPVGLDMKGTLLEGTGAPGSGSGGGLIPVPQVQAGVVETLFQRLTIANLLMEIPVTAPTYRYVVEGTATSGAAGVAEGGAKPESTLGYGIKDEQVKKVAHMLPVSDEMIGDAPALQGYINQRLVLFIKIEEERQLFRGTSGGNEVQGILTSRSVPVYAGGTAVGNKAIQLFKAINGVRGSAFVEPDFVVLHPTDWEQIRLLTDTAGQFLGGGPFLGPYGGPQGPIGSSSQVQGPQDTIWNKPVYVTAGLGGAGTALVGSTPSAAVLRKGGVSVEMSNSHSTWFALDLIALRAEERIGLAVFRPGGFCEVRLA